MARLPGSVHGVVVQMTTLALTSSPTVLSRTGNFTHTVSLVWSSYSTSASASAVFSTTDHITGLEPR
jgi:hypothetical protein